VIYKKIEETLALGGTGILMQGGVHPDLKIDYYESCFPASRKGLPFTVIASLLQRS
jgi:cyclic dehypoxanthinyl futalosine synthase